MTTDVTTLTFGIEIECLIPATSMQREAWTVGSYSSGAAVPGHDGWVTKHDGSIMAHYPMVGVEVVSPVLKGIEGLLSVKSMIQKLNAMGASVNRSTGFHVHIGWTGDAKQLRRLICLVAQHEKALFAATGTPNRENNTYCQSIKDAYRSLERMRTMNQAQTVAYHQGRYHVLNLHNLSTNKNTVEFRVFAGTVNFTKIYGYVSLCLGLVQRALDASRFPKWDYVKTAKQATQPDGAFAMMRLICALNWRELRGESPMGLMLAPGLPTRATVRKLMFRLARKYDATIAGRMARANRLDNEPNF